VAKQVSMLWKRLRRWLTDNPGRFAGGSAARDPSGLLAVEREMLAEAQRVRDDAQRMRDDAHRVRDDADLPAAGDDSSGQPR
jgi:hypothetical protein